MTGNVEMIIMHENGKVIQRFKHAVEYVEYEPQNCIDVAMAMTDAAFEARDGLKPVGETLKAELVERHRKTLTNRLTMMLATLRHGDKTDSKLAQMLVDTVLKEVF